MKINKSEQQKASIKNLPIEEIISEITVDQQLRRQIYELLIYPEQDIENINWRRDILSDFIRNRTLLDEFSHILFESNEIDTSLIVLVKSSANIFISSSGKAAYGDRDSAILKMRSLADILIKVLKLYMTAHEVFEKCKVYSELFVGLKNYFSEIVKKPEYEKLGELAKKLSASITLDTSYSIIVNLDKWLRIDDSSLFKISSDPYDYNLKKGEIAENPYDRTKVTFIGFSDVSDLQLQSFVELSTNRFSFLMESIVTQLKIPFENMQEGLYFYRFALLLERKLKEMKLPLCLPHVVEGKNIFECIEMCDISLALHLYAEKKVSGDIVVPNDIKMTGETGSLIITGENNAGKTVFLRSIGITQIFAQAGLPVCAKSAIISVTPGIYCYFSAMDTGQGRFEEEVSFLSNIIDVIKKGDLILLNEIFQSTSYEEASSALCDVLAAISIAEARTIAVTHLPKMKEQMKSLEKQYNVKRKSAYAEAILTTHKIIYDKQ